MFRPFHLHQPRYFQKHLSKQLEELYLSVAIQDFALAAVTLFEPIYLFEHGFGIRSILMYYILVYGVYYLLLPLGGKFVARFGPERSISISTIFLVAYYACLFLIQAQPAFFWVAPFMFSLQKTFYWPAYHADFITASDQGERGKEFSGLWSITTLMYILGPAFGGLMITIFGFNGLFGFVVLAIILSSIPLFISKITPPKETFSYWNSFALPFTSQHLRTMLGYFGLGGELILQVIWPLFLFLTFTSFTSLGGAIALATFFTAIITLYIGRMIDRGSRSSVIRWSTWLMGINWLIRPILATIPGIFISDTIGRITQNTNFVSTTSITYEKALKEKSVIERSVFYEQGFALSKSFLACVIIICMSWFEPFTASFVSAGLISFMYLIFAR